ncbi:MAG: hypothetical protein WC071_06175, partial [Victivallaceae bacterium]
MQDGSMLFNGQQIFFCCMICSGLAYVSVSLICKRLRGLADFDLNKMLHRGKFDKAHEHTVQTKTVSVLFRRLGMTEEFTAGDKIIFFCVYSWSIFWFLTFVTGITLSLFLKFNDLSWITFWRCYMIIIITLGTFTTGWLLTGGIIDMKKFFALMRSARHNEADDGRIVNGHNAGE